MTEVQLNDDLTVEVTREGISSRKNYEFNVTAKQLRAIGRSLIPGKSELLENYGATDRPYALDLDTNTIGRVLETPDHDFVIDSGKGKLIAVDEGSVIVFPNLKTKPTTIKNIYKEISYELDGYDGYIIPGSVKFGCQVIPNKSVLAAIKALDKEQGRTTKKKTQAAIIG